MGALKRNIVFMKGSKKYFFATLFLPPTFRNDVISLYNFSRLVDDFVDKKGYTKDQKDSNDLLQRSLISEMRLLMILLKRLIEEGFLTSGLKHFSIV